jgi:hypothetical protein
MILRSCTTTTHLRLPPELIDRIIDHLHDSPADLRTCARVCKAWLESSRLHLFYSISIHSTGNAQTLLSRCQKLYGVIRRSPRVALRVRELDIALHYHTYNGSTWLKIEKLLPPPLQSFTKLHRLDISQFAWTRSRRKSIQDLIALPSLIHLGVGANFYHFTILLPPSLKQLSLSGYWDPRELDDGRMHDADSEQESLLEQEPCHLEALTLTDMFESYSSAFIDWLLGTQSIIDISNLRTLSASCSPHTERYDTMRLVRRLGSSLEHLTIQHSEGPLVGELSLFLFSHQKILLCPHYLYRRSHCR